MENLVVDIGNTSTKIILVENEEWKDIHRFSTWNEIKEFSTKYTTIPTIISSVKNKEFTQKVASLFSKVVVLNHQTKLPIVNAYKTPKTLGNDRLANAVAANAIYPNQNSLIIDVGTCLKFDFVNAQSVYVGGSISLGFSMRYKALHTLTDNLPLYHNETTNNWIGNDTKSSITAGVYQGMLAEIKQFITLYESKFSQLNIILTGGDLSYFKNEELSQKNSIFADPLLTAKGLKVILDYNV